MKTLGTGNYIVSSDYLILLAELAFEHGISAADLLRDSGLPEELLFQPGVLVGHDSALRVVEQFCALTNDLSIALEYGKRMTLSKHGALGYAAQYSATMADAADKVTRYVETRAQIFSIARDASEHERHLFIEPRFNNKVAGAFLSLAFLASIETICRTLVGPVGREAESRILTSIETDFSAQQILPHCRVISSAGENSLNWPADVLVHPLPFFNPQLEGMAEQQLQSALTHLNQGRPVTAKVRQILENRLPELPTVETVAGLLCMSAATLNRKLKADGNSFQQLKDDVRFQHAQALLRTELPVDLVAERLGFSDASNFAKAFKTWAGVSPSQFRLQQ
ncbi:helix-turn-helix domain-containing protein [Thalassolituus sp. LLYu03]|uniref:helix-turn-helix domain-containing protein n=1 Tax=Thalassolituus sp. LLYu03 TaxID=3421656 RepID=UPI003D26AB28